MRNHGLCDCSACQLEADREYMPNALTVIGSILLASLLLICSCRGVAYAYTEDQIVTAIGKAENSKSHPYGIMVKFKHTSPRQACLNTVRNKYRDWVKSGCKGDFLAYLASRYAPIGAANDPQGLNRNWLTNVQYFLGRS